MKGQISDQIVPVTTKTLANFFWSIFFSRVQELTNQDGFNQLTSQWPNSEFCLSLLFSSSACISKYSAGSIFYYPSFHHIHNPAQVEKLQRDLDRYFTRKIGFEAVMRIRCTKGKGSCERCRACNSPVDSDMYWRLQPHHWFSLCQVYPSIRSMETSLFAPPTCCLWLMWTQTRPSLSKCRLKTLWLTHRWPASRRLCSTPPVKVHSEAVITRHTRWTEVRQKQSGRDKCLAEIGRIFCPPRSSAPVTFFTASLAT